jgi:hydrogenase maturation protein HypF
VSTIERRRFRVRGTVQGVGFRPFVYRAAQFHGLSGYVLNDGDGVLVEAEGDALSLASFGATLRSDPPSLAVVDTVEVELLPTTGAAGFEIVASSGTGATAVIPPDVATCDDCLRELFDPRDRRYRYPSRCPTTAPTRRWRDS